MLLQRMKIVSTANWLSGSILLVAVAAAPIPFGSTSRVAIAFWCMVLGFALVALSLRGLRRPQWWIMAGLFVIVLGYAFVLHEQLSDHPWIAPFHPIWARTSEILSVPIPPSVSIVKNEPFFALGAPLANLMSLLLGLVIGADRDRAQLIVRVIAWSGATYALYGIMSFLLWPDMLLWREKRAYGGAVTGTFVNANTAAVYFGSCGVVWLLLFAQTFRRRAEGQVIVWRQFIRSFGGRSARKVLPSFAAFAVCLMALFLSQSRAGVALSLLAMIVGFTIFMRKQLPPRIGVWIALGGGAVVALGLLQFLGSRVSNRYEAEGLVDIGRIEVWKSTLCIIADHPWFGTGMGTFPWSFPPYRSPKISMWGVWNMAHSTPLELAAEVGLPLAGLVAIGWLVMFGILARGTFTRRRDTLVPAAALTVAGLAQLHSAIDFTLQAPGYTIPFFALFGAGLAQSFPTRRSGTKLKRAINLPPPNTKL